MILGLSQSNFGIQSFSKAVVAVKSILVSKFQIAVHSVAATQLQIMICLQPLL